MINDLFSWLFDFFLDATKVFQYLFSPIVTIGDFSFSVISLISFGGLTAYLVVAIVKWGIS